MFAAADEKSKNATDSADGHDTKLESG